jgi:hypothetical protein
VQIKGVKMLTLFGDLCLVGFVNLIGIAAGVLPMVTLKMSP